MDSGVIGLFALIGALIVGRFISESGLKLLSDSEKARLLDDFSTMRKATPVIVLGLVGASFMRPDIASPLVMLLLLASLLMGMLVFSAHKIRTLRLPRSYLIRYICSQVLIIAGFFAYFVLTPR